MEVATLHIDEVEYELEIRGVGLDPTDDSFPALARLLELHKDDPVLEQRVGELDPKKEFGKLRTKVMEVEALLVEASAAGLMVDRPYRVASLYIHCVFRLRRILFRCYGKGAEEMAKLGRKLNRLHDVLSPLATNLIFPYLYIPAGDEEDPEDELKKLRVQMENLEVKKIKPEVKTEEKSSDSDEAVSKSSTKTKSSRSSKGRKSKKTIKKKKKHRRRHSSSSSTSSSSSSSPSGSNSGDSSEEKEKSGRLGKNNPLSRWKWRFSGKEDLFNFIDKVEESADVHGVDDATLLSGIPLLLEGDAHVWYRAKRKTISKWKHFKKEIKAAFEPAEDDEGLQEKLNNLRQKPDETFVVFEARFEELSKRLSTPLSDKAKLRKIIKGLHVFYRSRVTASEIDTLRTLRRKCQAWELDKKEVLKLEKEERHRHRKDKEEKHRSSGRVAAVEVEGSPSSDETQEAAATAGVVPLDTAAKRLGLVCWRCGQVGHMSFKCPEKIFCVNCGEKDTIAERCPRCARANLAGHWGPRPGNAQWDQQRGGLGPFHQPPPPLGQPMQPPPPRAPLVLQRPRGPDKN